MKDTMRNKEKKPSRHRYIIPAVLFLLLIFAGCMYVVLSYEPKPDPASERIIREIVAEKLTKDPNNPVDPNEMTDEDFALITKLKLFSDRPTDLEINSFLY